MAGPWISQSQESGKVVVKQQRWTRRKSSIDSTCPDHHRSKTPNVSSRNFFEWIVELPRWKPVAPVICLCYNLCGWHPSRTGLHLCQVSVVYLKSQSDRSSTAQMTWPSFSNALALYLTCSLEQDWRWARKSQELCWDWLVHCRTTCNHIICCEIKMSQTSWCNMQHKQMA